MTRISTSTALWFGLLVSGFASADPLAGQISSELLQLDLPRLEMRPGVPGSQSPSDWIVEGDGAARRTESAQRDLREALRLRMQEPSITRYLLLGAGFGAVLGFATGWGYDSQQDPVNSADSFWNYESDYYYRINGTVIGASVGAGLGGLAYWLRD